MAIIAAGDYVRAHVPYMHVTLSVPRSNPSTAALLPANPLFAGEDSPGEN